MKQGQQEEINAEKYSFLSPSWDDIVLHTLIAH